jgi:predicted metal-binding protein
LLNESIARRPNAEDGCPGPVAGLLQHQLHTISTEQYIELVAWSATIYCPGKHHLESPSAALKTMGCDEAEWKEQLNAVRCGWRVVGGSVQMRELAQRIGQQRFKRRSRRPGPAQDAPPLVDSR